MKKFDVDFEMQVRVEIENPEAVEAYFVHGSWKEVFWDLADLEDFVRSLTLSFDQCPKHWDSERGGISCSLEGFGTFNQAAGEDTYRLVPEAAKEIGSQLTVRVEDELEPIFVTERK